MQPSRGVLRGLAAVSLVALSACAGAASSPSGGTGAFPPGSTGTATGAGGTTAAGPGLPGGGVGTGAAGTGAANVPPLPPEQEVESSYEVPVATGRFVWITNPTSGRVAYVDATSLAVRTVEAGNGPTYLTPVPGTDDAVIVLNTLSNDATLLRVKGTALESRTFPGVAPGANAWAVSPDGRFAIAWTDARHVPHVMPTQGFQEATVIDLGAADAAKAHTTLTVGFRPVAFAFSADSKRAFAVTEDGVSVVTLGDASPTISGNVALGAGGTTDYADTRDVSITADGRLAIVRRDGSPVVGVVDLASGTRTAVTLGGPVTDLDVSVDGARAVAVVRDTSEVAILPLGGAAPAPEAVKVLAIAGETIGQVTLTAGGTAAVLYSNAVAAERITVVTLAATPTFRTVKLHASVLSALPTPDGKFAVVLHPKDPPVLLTPSSGDGGVADAGGVSAAPVVIPDATAFSLVPLDGTQPARIQMADAPIRTVAVAPASNRALVTVRDDLHQVFGVYLGLFPTLEVRRYQLASPPVSAGVVSGANRGYVAQQHPDGRITFLTLDSGDARTLTGYELGARVVDWSNP
jgi:hypothetical protein